MALITISPVSYSENPALWNQLLDSDPLQYPLGFPRDQEYMRAYLPQFSFRDFSMIASVAARPIAGLQVTLRKTSDGHEQLDFYGRPVLLRTSREASAETLEKAQRMLGEGFSRLRESLNFPQFDYLEMCSMGRLSELAIFLLKSGFTAAPVYKQIVDLRSSEEELHKHVRKSYRSLINWGEKNLAITVYDHHNIGSEIMEEFRQLHIAVAARETRSAQTWQLQYGQVLEKEGFVITGRLDGQLITAALFVHSPYYCYYGVGASVREMFDKPLSHAIVWRSILEAKRRGCCLYELGDRMDMHAQGYTEKERNISVFKAGFGGETFIHLKVA